MQLFFLNRLCWLLTNRHRDEILEWYNKEIQWTVRHPELPTEVLRFGEGFCNKLVIPRPSYDAVTVREFLVLFHSLSSYETLILESLISQLDSHWEAWNQNKRYFWGVLFIVRAGNDIIKADFMHTKKTTFLLKWKLAYILKS